MNLFRSGLLALSLATASVLPALADTQSQVIFQHKHWEVDAVALDDGSYACLAKVDAISDSFTIWVFQDKSVRLQFYSTAWDFGENDTANLQVKVGRRSPWNLTGADLYKQSILFNLPDSDQGVNFLLEVAQGDRLYLRTEQGEPVVDYSLAGSSASIQALIECSDALHGGGNSKNPFK